MINLTDSETNLLIKYLETKPYKEVETLILMLKKKQFDNKTRTNQPVIAKAKEEKNGNN